MIEIIKTELQLVEKLMLQEMSSDVPLAELVMNYTVGNGGKRFRPILTLLSSGVCGSINEKSIIAAAFIEFIHSATLLHDDVVDESPLRRGKDSANVAFGNAASVLVGDFLYTRAFQLMVQAGKFEVVKIMADAVNLIASGEVMQLSNAHDPNVDEERYFRVIELKTAVLFSAACKVAAELADKSEIEKDALHKYGKKMGMAFQIIDDLLDYTGNVEKLGKALGDDLAEGKPTLPLIRAQKQLPENERNRLREIIEQGNREAIFEVLELLKKTDALEYSQKIAEKFSREAIEALNIFPESVYKTALIDIVKKTLVRNK